MRHPKRITTETHRLGCSSMTKPSVTHPSILCRVLKGMCIANAFVLLPWSALRLSSRHFLLTLSIVSPLQHLWLWTPNSLGRTLSSTICAIPWRGTTKSCAVLPATSASAERDSNSLDAQKTMVCWPSHPTTFSFSRTPCRWELFAARQVHHLEHAILGKGGVRFQQMGLLRGPFSNEDVC